MNHLSAKKNNNIFFFFNSVLRPFQDYFSSYETGQLVGGVKTGEPREKEKPPDTPAGRTWLVSHVAGAGLEPTPDTAVKQVKNCSGTEQRRKRWQTKMYDQRCYHDDTQYTF